MFEGRITMDCALRKAEGLKDELRRFFLRFAMKAPLRVERNYVVLSYFFLAAKRENIFLSPSSFLLHPFSFFLILFSSLQDPCAIR